MTTPAVFEILEDVSSKKTRQEKIKALRSHKPNKALLALLQYTFHPDIVFDLPPGAPPYKECDIPDVETRLYQEVRKLYIFNKNTKINKVKKEVAFIEILESIHPKDAKILIAVKDKKNPAKGITKKLVQEAFPGLL